MKDNADKYVPHFKWKNYGRSTLVFVVDAVLLLAAGWLLFIFVRHLILGERVDIGKFTGEEWAKIIGHVAWPFAVTTSLFLFRNPLLLLLYETQRLISRSYYRHGDSPIAATDPKLGDQSVGGENGSAHEANSHEPQKGILFERKVIALLQQKHGVPIARNKCIDGSRYYFDGVMELDGNVYGIEVKISADARRWREVLWIVGNVYEQLSVERQKHFIFLACVVDDASIVKANRQILEGFAAEVPFRARFAFFTEDKKTGSLMEVQ